MKDVKDASGQVSEDIAKDWRDIWKNEKEGGFIDPSLIQEMFIPFLWTPTEMGCTTLDCDPEYKPKPEPNSCPAPGKK